MSPLFQQGKIYLGGNAINDAYLGSIYLFPTSGAAKVKFLIATEADVPGNTAFTARSTGTVLFDINWGDGNTETAQTSNALLHTYSSPGIYTVTITTTATYAIKYNNVTADTRQIISVSWDVSGVFPLGTTLNVAWRGSQNMTSFGFVDTSSVTSFNDAWRTCNSLTSFPLIDTSSATSMTNVWRGCSGLTSFPLIDTSLVGNIGSAWYGCTNLTSFPLIDTSSVTNMSSTWYNCSTLTSFPLIDTSSVNGLSNAWYGCNGLTSFPLIDTSSVNAMASTWEKCRGLLNFPLIDTGLVTTLKSAWQNCELLVSFPAISCASMTRCDSGWLACTSLTTFPANMFDTTGTLASAAFNNAFKNCALTAQSIENILTSLDTNGQSNIALDIDGGTNAGQSTWSTAANTAFSNLQTKGWTITYNP